MQGPGIITCLVACFAEEEDFKKSIIYGLINASLVVTYAITQIFN